jgi:hypothetical protein
MGENAMAHQYSTDVIERLADAGVDVPEIYRVFPEEASVADVMRAGERHGLDLGVLFCQSPTTAGMRALASAIT